MTAPPPRFGVVVPVKPPGHAKSRLAGLGDEVRRALATAFALDTVAAVRATASVDLVLVVTDDDRLAAEVRRLGASAVPDGTADDLNGSLEQGAAELRRRAPEVHLAAVCADLPALRPRELDLVLHDAAHDRLGFVGDAAGTGTTVVTAPDLSTFRPRFGPGSRAEHLAAGGVEVARDDIDSVRRDVDTPDDLAAAFRLGVGAHTARVTARLF